MGSASSSLSYFVTEYYFLHCQCFLPSLWTWLKRGQENVTVSAIHTFFSVPRVFWAFEHHSDTATLARLCCVTLGPPLCSRTYYWFSSKKLGKREHWPDEEQQIIVLIQENLLLKHPLCPREIRSKDLSNPMTTEGSGRASWSSGRCPFPMAGGWNDMIFKVPANPNLSLILWSTSWRFVFYL